MLDRDEDITARAVARRHSSIKNASDYTRHAERRALLEQAQTKQLELRKFSTKVRREGSRLAAEKLQAAEARIRALEENESARVSSHLAMIHAVAELGGTAKLLAFYRAYAEVRNRLHRQGALPENITAESRGMPLERST
ncbi:hypothetical protein [Paucibacter sp. B51]|uniref:hypothetical protein n=1 Tax=Paucibacter sp. B51 TaxID=2993315 RepID=UPI0022EBAF64|nr:hypothetical protein [Paucibacter sp. B51]